MPDESGPAGESVADGDLVLSAGQAHAVLAAVDLGLLTQVLSDGRAGRSDMANLRLPVSASTG